MPYLLNLVYLLGLIATGPFWLYKALTTGKYRSGLWEKLVGAPPAPPASAPVVWFHAVSVGEVLLLRPLLARFRAQHPEFQIALSTSTNAAHALAAERYPQTLLFYAPIDFSWAVRRVFDRLQPRLLVLTELELWPNLLLEASRRSVPVAVVNARLSERSFRGYRRLGRLLGPAYAAIGWWGAQTAEYAARIRELIGPAGAISVTGSMKYEGAATDRRNPKTAELRRLLGFQSGDVILVAGSTQAPEEEIVVGAFEQLRSSHPRLRLVLVPRHPERFAEVAELVGKRGRRFVRRSTVATPLAESPPVVLVDTMGELAAIWGLADLGFVGGSLDGKRGGQSMIEPAGYGVPVCFGPHIWNFRDTVEKLLAADAAVQLSSGDALVSVLRGWLERPEEAAAMGARARRFILAQQGSVQKTLEALSGLLEPAARRQSA